MVADKLDCMRYAGKVNMSAIEWGFHTAKPGTTLADVDKAIEWYIRSAGCRPAFKGYKPPGSSRTYEYTACLSLNHAAVHGLPNNSVLQKGDILTIDVGTEYQGWFVDSARTRLIESNNIRGLKLIEATEAILSAQLNIIKEGCNFLTLVLAANKIAKQYGVKVLSEYGGHGIGNAVHLEPFVPNAINLSAGHLAASFEEQKYKQQCFKFNETYCIEPVVVFGTTETYVADDGWTVYTKDGDIAAHTERTILVLKDGIEILS